MEGNYKSAHNTNSTNYNPVPADMNGANAAPFTVSYDRTDVNNPQASQRSYSQVGNFVYDPSYTSASVSPVPTSPQSSYATSDAGYGSGSNPGRRKMLAIMGGAVASLALAISLGGAALNKTNSHSYDQTPPTATSNNSSAGSNQVAEAKDTDPNMNVETADSEHDGKISYKIYECNPRNAGSFSDYSDYDLVGERTSQVSYSSNDTVDDRKEASMTDLVKYIAKRDNNSTSLNSLADVFDQEKDYHGHNAIVDLLNKYGGYGNTKLQKSDFINDFNKSVIMNAYGEYHYEDLASVDPNIVDGIVQVTVVNPNTNNGWNKYGGCFVIEILSVINKEYKHSANGVRGYAIHSGKIVCDSMPTEKELIQIIKDNYDIIFQTRGSNSNPIYPNEDSLNAIARDKRKPQLYLSLELYGDVAVTPTLF